MGFLDFRRAGVKLPGDIDLIRNYRLLIKGRTETESDSESQPLVSSSSSSRRLSFGSIHDLRLFGRLSDTDLNVDENRTGSGSGEVQISPVWAQRNLNRSSYFPYSFNTRELDDYGIIFQKNEGRTNISIDQRDLAPAESCFKEPETKETTSSLVTIFSVWNTTVGTSLLAMSWGIYRTGLFPSIFISILMAGICLYTAYVLLKVHEKHGVRGHGEVTDLCRTLLGPWAEIVAKVISIVVLLGANIVYWILMSNFLYNSVNFFHDFWTHINLTDAYDTTVICPKEISTWPQTVVPISTNKTIPVMSSNFEKVWDLYSTVPVMLAVPMFFLLNWEKATVFKKFNCVGTGSVMYMIMFVAVKGMQWGINMPDWAVEFNMKSSFCVLTGMLSLSYFIHNIIISLMRHNKHQENNGRDLSMAFGLITFTYLFIGIVFYITFPLPKSCIEDNILNNFNKYDGWSLGGRIVLLFQLITVFPLMTYMLRLEVFANLNMFVRDNRFSQYSRWKTMLVGLTVLIICVLFACFLPRIGTLIRYTGALSGFVYVFMLPGLLKLASLKKEGTLTPLDWMAYMAIMTIGGLNLIGQLFINDT